MRFISREDPECQALQGGHDSYREGLIRTLQPPTRSPNGGLLIFAPSICEEADYRASRVFADVRPLQTVFAGDTSLATKTYGIRFWCFADGETTGPSKTEELTACLEWAAGFAEGSMEVDESLDNPVFQAWLLRCKNAIELAKP
jgi:hypothetical protein